MRLIALLIAVLLLDEPEHVFRELVRTLHASTFWELALCGVTAVVVTILIVEAIRGALRWFVEAFF